MPKNPAAVLSLATALALTLGACGGAKTTAEEPPAEPTPAVTKTPASSGSIDSQEALAIALQNAGLQESDVTVDEIGCGRIERVTTAELKQRFAAAYGEEK